MGIAIPLGLLAAVFMNEVPGPYARFIRTVVDAMTAMPDVLAGLFIYATLIQIFGIAAVRHGGRARARDHRAADRLPGRRRGAAADARRADRGRPSLSAPASGAPCGS